MHKNKMSGKILSLATVLAITSSALSAADNGKNVSVQQNNQLEVQKNIQPQNDPMAKKFDDLKSKFKFLKDIKYVKGQDRGSFVQMMLEAPNGQRFEMVFIPNSDYVVAGKVFNKEGSPVNLPADMEEVKKGVAFTIGHGPKKYYLVTDPECPYCQNLEKEMAKVAGLENEVTIMVIPMPLSFHKHARPMMYYILSAKTPQEKAERMKKVMTGEDDKWKTYKPSEEEKAKYEEILAKGKKAALELGARGTPSMFKSDGQQVNPYSIIIEIQKKERQKSSDLTSNSSQK